MPNLHLCHINHHIRLTFEDSNDDKHTNMDITHNAALASLNMDVMFEYTPGDFNNIDDAVTNNAEPSPSVPPISLTHESPLTTFNKILEKDHCKLGK